MGRTLTLILLIIGVLLLTGCSSSVDSADDGKYPVGSQNETSDIGKKNEEAAKDIPKGTIPGDPKDSTDMNADELYIREKMFITQINDIFYNIDEYKDKTIAVEGMFRIFPGVDGQPDIPVVFRNGPGCCGNDGWAGFLLHYDGEYPAIDEWILVKGKPEIVQTDLYMQLYLNVTSLEIKKERGAEFVDQ